MWKILTSSLVFLVSISNVVPYLPQMIQSAHAVGINEVESKKDVEIVQNSEDNNLTEFVDFYQEIKETEDSLDDKDEETEDLPIEEGGQETTSLEEKSEAPPGDNEIEVNETTIEMEKNTGSGLIRDLFPDPIVAEEVAGWFNRTVNHTVSIEDDLKRFMGPNNDGQIVMRDMGIRSIEGLQYFERINTMQLEDNQITDISPLASFASLTYLSLSRNNISQINALSSHTDLTFLDVRGNRIENTNALYSLQKLTHLNLSNNKIKHLENLDLMEDMVELAVMNNEITGSLMSLSAMNKLEELYIHGNNITRLDEVSSLESLTLLWAGENEISQLPSEFNLPNLVDLGLNRNQFEDISSLASLKNVVELNLGVNKIKDLSPLSQLENLVSLRIPRNKITDMRPIASLVTNGLIVTAHGQEIELPAVKLGESYPVNLVDYLGNNPVINWINPGNLTGGNLTWGAAGNNSASFESSNHPNVVFNGTIEQEVMVSNPLVKDIFPDPNLAEAVAEEFNRTVNDQISIVHELNAQVGTIDFSNRQISQLDGMEYFTGVTSIDFRNNQISDIGILTSNLSSLRTLLLNDNQIRELPNEINLPRLTNLQLNNNKIENIKPLKTATLTSVHTVDLAFNEIADISPLSNLTNLATLNIRNNRIADISPLSNLTNLATLNLSNNRVEEVSTLSGLTSLVSVSFNMNQISDITSLSNLTSLSTINFHSNKLDNLPDFSKLNRLSHIDLRFNQISDISPLNNCINLTSLFLNDQVITLDPVLLGSDNPFTLATLDGIPMQTDFRTEGALVENQLGWVNSGPNRFTFNGSGKTEMGRNVSFSGTVTQEVILDFGLTAVPERFEFGRTNSISPSLSQIQADSTEVVTVEDNRPDHIGWRLQVRMAELTSSTNNRLTGTTMSIKTSFTETAEGEVPHLFDTLTINNANRQLVSANPGEGTGKWSIGFDQLTLNVPGSVARTGESYTGNVTWTLLNTP